MSTLTPHQVKTYGPRQYQEKGTKYLITATVRHDDRCGNGHNTFSITANIQEHQNGRWRDYMGGCCHDEVAKHFPELAPFIKWHLCSTDGPMHYIANTLYHAGDRDYNGLRKGEKRQIRTGRTGKLCWIRTVSADLPKYVDADEQPTETATVTYEPWYRVGEGKERELDAARRSAIWLDATDEELLADDLKQRLIERHPALMEEFQAAVESLGFVY